MTVGRERDGREERERGRRRRKKKGRESHAPKKNATDSYTQVQPKIFGVREQLIKDSHVDEGWLHERMVVGVGMNSIINFD